MIYREAHTLLEALADATLVGTREAYLADLATVPLLIIDDLGMRKTALLDRLLNRAHILKCGPRSWRTKLHTDLRTEASTK